MQPQSPPSPLGSFPELAAMYNSSFQLPLSNAQTSSQANADQATVSAAKAAQSAKNYQVVQRPDGGFGFYDPSGKEITAAEYASVTGKNVSDILKNSSNPIDIGHAKDFKDLQDYINLKLQSPSDKAAGDKAHAIEQDVQKQHGINISQLKPDQLIQAFRQAYPTIYGQGGFQGAGTAGIPVGQTLIPQATNNFVQQYYPQGAGTGGQSGFSL